jgi:hypothetical protein
LECGSLDDLFARDDLARFSGVERAARGADRGIA